MAFDLSTAQPVVQKSGGFDLSTAKPVNDTPQGKPRGSRKSRSNAGETESPDFKSKLGRDATRSALQGVTFGFSDEIGAAISAPLVKAVDVATGRPGSRSLKEIYNEVHGDLKKDREVFKEERPAVALATELAGGIVTGGAGVARTGVLKGMQGLSSLQKVGRVAGVGAIEGGIYGAGSADQGERLKGAGKGALVGGIAAPVGAKVVDTGLKALGNIGGYLGGRALASPKEQAGKMLRDAAKHEGLNPDEAIKRIAALGDEGVIADAGESFNRLGRAVSDMSPEMNVKAKKVTEVRQAQQQDRLKKAARIATGKNGEDLTDTVYNITKQRSEKASPIYQEAYDQGVEITPEMEKIIDRLGKSMKKAQSLAKREGADVGDNTLKTLHYAKMSLDDDIGRAFRSGEKVSARASMKLKSDLLDEIEKQNPTYKQANAMFAGDSQLLNAASLGRNFMKEDAETLAQSVKGMRESELESFKLGAAKAFEEKLDTVGLTHNAANRLFNTTAMQNKMRVVFGDEFTDVIKAANKEEAFTKTRARLSGSQTSTNEAGKDQLQSGLGFMQQLTTGNTSGAVFTGLSKVLGVNQKSPEFYKELGDLMFTQGLSPVEVRKVFEQPSFRDAVGDSYDKIVLPYIQSITAVPATAPLREG